MADCLFPYGLYSPPGSSVHGILQARILERVTMPSSGGYSWPKDRTHLSYISCCLNSLGRETFIWDLGQRQRPSLPFVLSMYFQKPLSLLQRPSCVDGLNGPTKSPGEPQHQWRFYSVTPVKQCLFGPLWAWAKAQCSSRKHPRRGNVGSGSISTIIGSPSISTTHRLSLTKYVCSMPQFSHLQDGPSNTLLYNSEMCPGTFT